MMDKREKIRCDLSAYLDGELDSQRLAEVAAALENDATLAKELDELRAVRKLVGQQPELSAGHDFAAEVLSKSRQAKPSKSGPNYYRLAAAAGVVLVACGALLVSVIQLGTGSKAVKTEPQLSIKDQNVDELKKMAERVGDDFVKSKAKAQAAIKKTQEKAFEAADESISVARKKVAQEVELAKKAAVSVTEKYDLDGETIAAVTSRKRKSTRSVDAPGSGVRSEMMAEEPAGMAGSGRFKKENVKLGAPAEEKVARASSPKVSAAKPDVRGIPIFTAPPEPEEPAESLERPEVAKAEPEIVKSVEDLKSTLSEDKDSADLPAPVTVAKPEASPVLLKKPDDDEPKLADRAFGVKDKKLVTAAQDKPASAGVTESKCVVVMTPEPAKGIAKLSEKSKPVPEKETYFQVQLTQARSQNSAIIVTDDINRDRVKIEKIIASNSIKIVPPAKADKTLVLNQARNSLPRTPEKYEYVLFAESDKLEKLKAQLVAGFGVQQNSTRNLRNQLIQNFALQPQLALSDTASQPVSQDRIGSRSNAAAKEVMVITIETVDSKVGSEPATSKPSGK